MLGSVQKRRKEELRKMAGKMFWWWWSDITFIDGIYWFLLFLGSKDRWFSIYNIHKLPCFLNMLLLSNPALLLTPTTAKVKEGSCLSMFSMKSAPGSWKKQGKGYIKNNSNSFRKHLNFLIKYKIISPFRKTSRLLKKVWQKLSLMKKIPSRSPLKVNYYCEKADPTATSDVHKVD